VALPHNPTAAAAEANSSNSSKKNACGVSRLIPSLLIAFLVGVVGL
jgi:hypothetical protein